MTKYNISEKQTSSPTPSYKRAFTPEQVEQLAGSIITKLLIEGKYRDPNYSARRLAEELGVNMRYISAVVSLRFQQNYSELVAQMRIHEAKYMLQEPAFDNMTIEDIAINVGFGARQSFYQTFYKLCHTTPKEYRMAHAIDPKGEQKQGK